MMHVDRIDCWARHRGSRRLRRWEVPIDSRLTSEWNWLPLVVVVDEHWIHNQRISRHWLSENVPERY